MKTAKKLTGGILSAAKEAEATLARQEARDLENGLPEGHPLRDEVDKQKTLIGDLSGLPPGHPLLVAMQHAKERYEQQQVQRAEEQSNTTEVRKSQKIDDNKAKAEARRAEEEKSEKRVEAAKTINGGIDGTLSEIRKLYKMTADYEEILNIDPISRAKVGRLKRLLFAAERGLSDGRLPKVRA